MTAEDGLVAVHAHYKTPAESAGMDFFKFCHGKIVEHGDVVQDLPQLTANPLGGWLARTAQNVLGTHAAEAQATVCATMWC